MAGPRVVVAMSGGVDSSVAAALLVQQGYDVVGMMMRLWSEPGREAENRCCTPDALAQARLVAGKLGIPFYAVDARTVFYEQIVSSFIDAYAQGATPNPCLSCNRHIRWTFLLQRALSIDAQFMATGHYVRLIPSDQGQIQIQRAVDQAKDQSYVLHVLNQDQLRHAIFPLGELTKPQVRQLARDFNLPVAERPESQDLCFLGETDYRSFLARNYPDVLNPGPIQTSSGLNLGRHQGLAFYTIGQRKGLGIAAAEPLYVLRKDRSTNTLVVGPLDELGQTELTAANLNWVAGVPPAAPLRLQVKIRYKAAPAWGILTLLPGNQAHIRFDQKMRDITPGQAAVFYDGDIVLGGGIIQPS